jgi:hypothetical protein
MQVLSRVLAHTTLPATDVLDLLKHESKDHSDADTTVCRRAGTGRLASPARVLDCHYRKLGNVRASS